jgi:protein-disulfide isomerase
MSKRFWIVILAIFVIFGGIIFVNNHSKNNKSGGSTAAATNHVEGNTSSKVTLVEYGDYQCPVCEGYYSVVQQVQQKYNDTVKFQFRNLPLPASLHPLALEAARAAEAADMQGKFWQMHDALYDSQNYDEWAYDPATQSVRSADPMPLFKTYAKELGLNVTKFQTDFASSAVNNRVQADIAAFNKTKQDMATPTFFINGKYYANTNFADSNGPSVSAFSKVLDKALKDAK